MSDKTNFLGVEIPHVIAGICSTIDIYCFPNPNSPIASLVKTCELRERVCYDDDIVSNFQNKYNFRNTLMSLHADSLVWKDEKGFGLTKEGKNLAEIISWFAPIYELLEFLNGSGISSVDELDIQLTMAGKHSLISKDAVERARIVFCYGERTLGLNAYVWVKTFLICLDSTIKAWYEDIFKELFKRLDSNELAA